MMKSQHLPLKRKPASKGLTKRLSAVVSGNKRKQRVAATAQAEEFDIQDSSAKISRALTIIFLIHVVAIALIFVHWRFYEDRETAPKAKAATTYTQPAEDLPVLSLSERAYTVHAGDNYARIAASHNISETELRNLNDNASLSPGMLLRLPKAAETEVASTPAPVAIPVENEPIDDGLIPVTNEPAPRAIVVRPADTAPATRASTRSYTVRSGDSIYAIARRHNVNQNELMRINGIRDARSLRVGAKLRIP